ncbi:MAG: YegS/Rv2252/BmrU family lipid kinase [Lachnospiraceae bacterium]|nr:YegS/Rv2252/BmrU family lipid kinase [Lachnospiraceae bacterium]
MGETIDKKKMLFIYNPHAGKAQIRSNLLDMIDVFTKAGYEVTAYPTQEKGDAIKATVGRSDGYELIACSGGDGTLDEVVTGMMQCEKRIPIGYVPAGTTNDFAHSLGISSNMTRAARTIVEGIPFPCDIGSFNDDTFVYIAAFGMFTDVSYATDQTVKNILGHLAYLLEGAKRITEIPSYHLTYEHDGIRIEGDYMYGMVTNSLSVGGFRNITGRHVHLDDGLFEVTLIKRPTNLIELNLILTSLVGRRIHTDYMDCFKTSELIIETEDAVAWTLDGEFGGLQRRVHIKNELQALSVITNPKKL